MSKNKELSTHEAVQNAINEIDFQTLINEEVKSEASKAIKEVIANQFRWRGSIKKQIEEEFEKISTINLEKLGIDRLGLLMSDSIVEATNDLIAGETKEVVQKHLYQALDGFSKLNDINSIVEELASDLSEKFDYDDEDVEGNIQIEYHEERIGFGSYTSKYWTIRIEDTDEKIRFSLLDGKKGKVYSLHSNNIDVLSPVLERLDLCNKFNLLAVAEENDYYYNNHED